MSFDLSNYEPVATRIDKFYANYPTGRILTEIVMHPSEQHKTWVVCATVYRDDDPTPAATGFAEETPGAGNVNRTSALENCETSAIGRALANLNFATKGQQRPSREEMQKAKQVEPLASDEQIADLKQLFEDIDVEDRPTAKQAFVERFGLPQNVTAEQFEMAFEWVLDEGWK